MPTKFLVYSFIAISIDASCSNTKDEDARTINSPNYPSTYPNSKRCSWKVTAPEGAKLKIERFSYHLEYNSVCRYDYLKIYDGPSSSSYRRARLCGAGSYELTSTTNSLYFEFKSDGSNIRSGFELGFSLIGM